MEEGVVMAEDFDWTSIQDPIEIRIRGSIILNDGSIYQDILMAIEKICRKIGSKSLNFIISPWFSGCGMPVN
jgi:hypothetical protein